MVTAVLPPYAMWVSGMGSTRPCRIPICTSIIGSFNTGNKTEPRPKLTSTGLLSSVRDAGSITIRLDFLAPQEILSLPSRLILGVVFRQPGFAETLLATSSICPSN